jgi:hypothetical protein
VATGTSDAAVPDAGNTLIGHQVGDLDLEAMAQPGSEWLTDGPVHGSGPATVSLPPARGRDRMLHIAFLCLDTAGRAVQTFEMGSPVTVMPRIKVPRGASWVLFAWLAPLSIQPGAGVSADGSGLRQFTGYGLSFTYPRSWYSQAPDQVDPTLAETLEFESAVPLRDACPVTTDSTGTSGGGIPAAAPRLPPSPRGAFWSTGRYQTRRPLAVSRSSAGRRRYRATRDG